MYIPCKASTQTNIYSIELPPHQEIDGDKDEHHECDEVHHVPGAVGRNHRAQLAYRRGKQVRSGGEARALDGMIKRIHNYFLIIEMKYHMLSRLQFKYINICIYSSANQSTKRTLTIPSNILF